MVYQLISIMLKSFLGSSLANHSCYPIIHKYHFTLLCFFIQFSRYTAARGDSRFSFLISQATPRGSCRSALLLAVLYSTRSAAYKLKVCSHCVANCLQRSWWWAQDGQVHLSMKLNLPCTVLLHLFLLHLCSAGGLKWTRTIDLTLIRRAL